MNNPNLSSSRCTAFLAIGQLLIKPNCYQGGSCRPYSSTAATFVLRSSLNSNHGAIRNRSWVSIKIARGEKRPLATMLNPEKGDGKEKKAKKPAGALRPSSRQVITDSL